MGRKEIADQVRPEAKKIILALEMETGTAIAIPLIILKKGEGNDPKDLIRNAVREFLNTPEGKDALKETCGAFNWGDAANLLPDRICDNHGFRFLDPLQADEIVDLNEQLTADY